ncbi:hypothetical protein CCR75_008061 [Bremia lactucae]|uniref:non-specific serine/threonine protein kinase n=1 Tax=Bremia lactucae TaxID=4779 RepID=A0A976FNH6_BRELC|nr:hypothetical protein CCR75_008061 [Bremia lactucae]
MSSVKSTPRQLLSARALQSVPHRLYFLSSDISGSALQERPSFLWQSAGLNQDFNLWGAMSGRASIGDYVVTSKLGSGSFAVVYKGYHKTSKIPVAIKALSLHKLNGKLLSNLEMEIAIMRQIDHPNVVKLYEIKKTDKHMYLVLEFCAGGDLQHYMRRQQQQSGSNVLTENVAQHFLRELAKGMQCLWQHNLIHRDLKPQNLLLVEDSPTSALKIADFGFARHLATASMAETLCGSPLYMAPEILKFQKYDAKADLWSVGTILFEMVAGRPPYGGANHVQLLANIERQPLRFPPTLQLSRSCHHLLVALLQRKPALRLGFADFFMNSFVDLQPLPEQTVNMEALRHSPTLATTESIREEDEEDVQESGRRGMVKTVESSALEAGDDQNGEHCLRNFRRDSGSDRPFSASQGLSASSHVANSVPSANSRPSRSGNLEVMEAAFACAGSGSGALRRSSSSRLARSRRGSSSGSGLAGANTGTSLRCSPQMSPHVLPIPSPRINPFKQLSDKPYDSRAHQQLQQQQSLLNVASSQLRHNDGTGPSTLRNITGGGHALDSSGEYVLVDESSERRVADGADEFQDGAKDRCMSCLSTQEDLMTRALTSGSGSNIPTETFSREYGQQLIDIVVLRTQAIAPLADQLWALSTASATNSSCRADPTTESVGEVNRLSQQTAERILPSSAQGEKDFNCANLSTDFFMSSSLASSIGVSHTLGGEEVGDDDEENYVKRVAECEYIYAAEALVLYVKCLRLVQRVVLYFRHVRVSRVSPDSPLAGWSNTSLKISLAFLAEHLTHFLVRAEQCKVRMAHASRFQIPIRSIASQEELLYANALRIGRQGAIREVLGQARAAHDHYLQALLLLESLLLDAPGADGSSTIALAVDDQKNINVFLRALEMRLKNVRILLDEDKSSSGASRSNHMHQFRQQLTHLPSATAAVP